MRLIAVDQSFATKSANHRHQDLVAVAPARDLLSTEIDERTVVVMTRRELRV